MFTSDFYLDLVNKVYGTSIKIGDLPTKHPRIIYRLEKYFEDHPLQNDKFSHLEPAIYLRDNIADFVIPEEVHTRFQELFSELSDLLVINKYKQQGTKKNLIGHIIIREKHTGMNLTLT